MGEDNVKIYKNEDVVEIIAAIPRGHYHTRFLIRFKDQEIILQEATVAALVRAYAMVAAHPTRRGVISSRRRSWIKKKRSSDSPVYNYWKNLARRRKQSK